MRPIAATVLLACLALSCGARATEADDRLWAVGSNAAKVCAPCLDDYLIVPEYRADCGSSRGIPLDTLRKQLATEYTWPNNKGKEERHTAPADEAEVRAADALRTLDPGDYGWLHSVEVVKVNGEHDMLVTHLQLADAKMAKADLEKFSGNVTANAKKEQDAAKDAYDRQIDALEKQKKNLEAWRAFGKEQGKNNQNAGKHDGATIKIDELESQIKQLEQREKDLLKQLSADKSALLKAAKKRMDARRDADSVQKKKRKELGQTFRLTGFATAHLRAGDRFAGPRKDGLQVAVAWRDKSGSLVLAPVELLKKPLDKPGLGALLAKRKTTPAEFTLQLKAAKRGKTGEAAKQAVARAMAQLIRDK